MKAARLFSVGDLQIVSEPDPRPAAGEVLIRVAAAGICGTDRHILKGEFPSRPPVILGHEFAGHVVECGDGADGLSVGDLVTVDPNIACGRCPACRIGRVNLCHSLTAIGVHRDGGFAEFVAVPVVQAHKVPAGLPPALVALTEPLACCLHGVDVAKPIAGERAIVVGGGVIGLMCAQLLRNAGVEVMLVTRQASKRDLASSIGVHATAASADEARAIWPDGAQLVMECAGVQSTVEDCQRLVGRGGRIVVLGVLPVGMKVAMEPFDLLVREVRIDYAFLNPFTQGRAARMIAEGTVDVGKLITRMVSLEEAPSVIAAPATPGEVRVIVVPGQA